MRLTTAIVVGFIISPVLAAGLVMAGIKGIGVMSRSHAMAASSAAVAAEVAGIAQDGNRLYRLLADTVITRDLALADKPWKELKTGVAAHLDRIDLLVGDEQGKVDAESQGVAFVEDAGNKAHAADARKAFTEFVATYEKDVVMMVKIDAEASDLRPIAAKLAGTRDVFMASLSAIADAHAAESASAAASYESIEKSMYQAAWVAAGAAIAVNLLLAWLVARKARYELTIKVGKVLTATAAAEQGDLSARTGLAGSDVSDRVGQALERFLSTLQTNIKHIANTGSRIDQAATNLVSTGGRLNEAAEVTARQSAGAAGAAAQVSRNSQTVAAALEEMVASIQEISRNSQDAAGVAREAMGAANEATSVAAKLSKSSADISTIVNTITSIAEQTNLLALNATIEAARAGESGRGFAVVAGEVKALASQTQKATGDISSSISALQADCVKVAQVIEVIATVGKKIETLQASIAAAVEEQNATTQEATRSMGEVAKGYEEIAGSVAAVAEAAKRTSAGVLEVRSAADDMGVASGELKQAVGTYRLS